MDISSYNLRIKELSIFLKTYLYDREKIIFLHDAEWKMQRQDEHKRINVYLLKFLSLRIPFPL